MDSQARLLIPQILRNSAELDDQEAVVIGMGTYIAVHNRRKFEQNMLANKLTAEDRARLKEITSRRD
jgi:DNA-binding transcriptional regulator/RsmH inhibitor MraZ